MYFVYTLGAQGLVASSKNRS